MDLFAAAIAQQKREAAAAAQAQRRGAGEDITDEASAADQTPEEAQRLREWKKKQDEEERKAMAKSWRNLGAATAVALLIGYIALGIPDGSDKGKEEAGNGLVAWNNRVGKNFKAMFEVRFPMRLSRRCMWWNGICSSSFFLHRPGQHPQQANSYRIHCPRSTNDLLHCA